MCTAVSWQSGDHYFGRNLDLEYTYRESITVTPRSFPIPMRKMQTIRNHYAMIGMATVADNFPLYYEATNEKGLSMAGLNFPGLACYFPKRKGMYNVTPFELIPWVLSQCAAVAEAEKLLQELNLVDIPFSDSLPLSPLHWILSDRESSVTIETADGLLRVSENPVGILTNNPPFDYHLYNLRHHLNASSVQATNRFSDAITLEPFSNGMGGIGLPGDFSSASRFIKAAFVKLNSPCHDTEEGAVSHFFRILSSVAMPRGSVVIRPGEYEITQYSSCCNTTKGIYYYTTYSNMQVSVVDMHREDLNGNLLICYPLRTQADFFCQN